MTLENIIKLSLSVILLLCLLDMPYGYFEFVRYSALIGFGLLAYLCYKKSFQTEMFIFAALAILFQPFYKIMLGRETWNKVDLIIALGLLLSILVDRWRK